MSTVRNGIFVLILLFSIFSCGQAKISPEEARMTLAKMNIQYSESSFLESIKNNDIVAVKLFIAAGMNRNVRDSNNNSPLILAIHSGYHELAKILIGSGFNLNIINNRNETALIITQGKNDKELIDLFYKNNAFYGIPKEATIIEMANIDTTNLKNRAFILWMSKATKILKTPTFIKYDRKYYYEDSFMQTTGSSFYKGLVKISLIDMETKILINTVDLVKPEYGEFVLPIKIINMWYFAINLNEYNEGTPIIMTLVDWRNNSKKEDFVLFHKDTGSGIPETTLIGYSDKEDKVKQFPITTIANYNTSGKKDTEHHEGFWSNIFAVRNNYHGGDFWEFSYDVQDVLASYKINYDKNRELFNVSVTYTDSVK